MITWSLWVVLGISILLAVNVFRIASVTDLTERAWQETFYTIVVLSLPFLLLDYLA